VNMKKGWGGRGGELNEDRDNDKNKEKKTLIIAEQFYYAFSLS